MSDPGRLASVLRRLAGKLPRVRGAVPLAAVAAAALAGGLTGWIASGLVLPAAPAAPAVAGEPQGGTYVVAVAPSIVVEPLPAPDAPPVVRIVAGPAHRPAELALLFFRDLGSDNAAPEEPAATAAGEAGSPPSSLVTPGPAHRPAELFPLLVARQDAEPGSESGRVLPGPPHTMPELTLLLARALSPPVVAALRLSPGSRDPGRFDHALPEPASVRVRPGPPHTMPEIVLLYSALLAPPDAAPGMEPPGVALRGTWWIVEEEAAAPVPGERPRVGAPDAVAITETGPEIVPDTAPMTPTDPRGTPMIAIIIDDLGLNARRAERVAALPGPLTLAFIPYGEGLDIQTTLAAAAGHEIFLHLPMQPVSGSENPGPHALTEALDAAAFAAELAWNLDRFGGYVGVNNHMGSLLTQDSEAMAVVMAELDRRGLVFVDSMTSAASVAYDTALRQGVPVARRDVFLDNVPETAAIDAQLDKLEALARSQGYAIAIGHPHDATIAALAAWLPDALRRGLVLVPASRIAQRNPLHVAQTKDQNIENTDN